MNRGANSDSIPVDLIPEILSRLPAKSVARFRCVSKLWGSTLGQPYFTELFLTRSSARPRLLIGVRQGDEWSFFSSPQPHNPYEESSTSSLVVAADFHLKFSGDRNAYSNKFSYASGLIYFPDVETTKKYDGEVHVICNPSTGQYAILPPGLRTKDRFAEGYLGFDPIGKQFKVWVFDSRSENDEMVYHTLTLGSEKERWRTTHCPFYYGPCGEMICINGVLYFIGFDPNEERYNVIGCFDVRYEKFKFLSVNKNCYHDSFMKLVNYKGKLGLITFEEHYHGGFPHELRMWILEDVEKREWSTYVYTLRAADNKVVKADEYIYIVGVTALGEIVLAKKNAFKPFYVFYYNPEKNTLLNAEIQGVREEEEWFNDHSVYIVVEHVEDLKFDVMKTTYAATSITPQEQSTLTSSREDHQVRTVAYLEHDHLTFESVNKFDALSLLDDD